MLRFLNPRRLAILALTALALPVVLAGCSSEKITTVDPAYTELEGTPDPLSKLYVWPDVPTEVHYYADLGTPGPSTADTLLEVVTVYRSGPGTVRAMLLDGSLGSGFEFYRRATNGGYQPMRDYTVNLPRKWLESHWELYELADSHPSGFAPPSYKARGLLEGTATAQSPLTNEARLTGTTTSSMVYTGNLFPARADTNFTMSWAPVPGAAGYWMHVMQFRSNATTDEIIASATPGPIWNGKVNDQFVGYIAAPATSYKLGEPGALVLTYTPPIGGQVYMVRITAVDAEGQVIAGIGTDLDHIEVDVDGSIMNVVGGGYGIVQGDGFWRIFPMGASVVNPGGTDGTPSFARTADGATLRIASPGPVPAARGRR